ncbi:polysaccharide deacetylase family protein [Bacillus sp. 165]|uniref:polysaccharide deacetylase family protein n=1 Tax=Bacillus sp. 165 TaxID=1529117 RepID=UPI001ADAACD0|nr:polysaccharide deacetylase family protein [Bacillus sp. 165]MBO9131250.1 polysaccharide deacetylase family protein [Bacillus sp. 165]
MRFIALFFFLTFFTASTSPLINDTFFRLLKRETIITWNPPPTYNSTSTTLYTNNIKDNISAVRYHIWRTADGKQSTQTFKSTDKRHNFPFRFNLSSFQSKRGEFNVEAYGIKKDGTEKHLAQASLTFPQYISILMYHSIDTFTGSGLKELYVSPESFEAQINFLKTNGYTLLTFEHWNDINKVNKPVIVTFDDGYKNNLNAYKTFQKLKNERFHPCGTLFVITELIGKPKRLTASDLKELSDSGYFSVQSHSATHPDLRKIRNYEYELKSSKDTIKKITGKPVIALAYPYGFFNEKVINETQKYYNFAVTVKKGQYIEKGLPNELYTMPRVWIEYDTTLEQFADLVRVK